MMKFGVHISISGGLLSVVKRAVERGCETIQIFTRSPRGWTKPKNYSKEEIETFKDSLKKEGISPLVIHLPYLPNIASGDKDLYERSIEVLYTDLKVAEVLDSPYVVVHFGSHGGSNEELGIKRVVNALNIATSMAKNNVMILLENQVGAGTELGYDFLHFKKVLDEVDAPEQIGMCFDICHGYAAGYDIKTKDGLEETLSLIDKVVGIERIKLLHANDSKAKIGERTDRHAHIGEGYIGLEGFSQIVNHRLLLALPTILETPVMSQEDDIRNLSTIRSLVG